MHVICNFRVYIYKVGKPFRSTIICYKGQEINSIYNYMIMPTAEDSQDARTFVMEVNPSKRIRVDLFWSTLFIAPSRNHLAKCTW